MKDIWHLKLHQSMQLSPQITVTRVASGWLYSSVHGNNHTDANRFATNTQVIFVPYISQRDFEEEFNEH